MHEPEFTLRGQLPLPAAAAMSLLADLAAWTAKSYPNVTAVRVGTAPYHHAGATAAQDIAFGMATGVEYLRVMTRAGLDVDTAARQILFSISLGTHHFLAIAKLRAGRRLWARIVEACGGSPTAGAMRIHARTSKRVLTQRDPYVNLLRNTVACFAAGIGGAEAITSVPFAAAVGLPDALSRRIARSTQLFLQQETDTCNVDPWGGSYYVERLTHDLARRAWQHLREVEELGGMTRAIQSGMPKQRIEEAAARTQARIDSGQQTVVGLNKVSAQHARADRGPQGG